MSFWCPSRTEDRLCWPRPATPRCSACLAACHSDTLHLIHLLKKVLLMGLISFIPMVVFMVLYYFFAFLREQRLNYCYHDHELVFHFTMPFNAAKYFY